MLVTTTAHGRLIAKRFAEYKDCSVDSETVPKEQYRNDKKASLIIGRFEILMWSIAHRGESYSFPTNLIDPKYPSMQEWRSVFAPLFLNKKIVKVMHNYNYDANAFLEHGIMFANIWDTAIGCNYSNANIKAELKSRAALYGRRLKKTKTVNFSDTAELSKYAEEDVVATDEMFQMQVKHKVRRPSYIQYIRSDGSIKSVKNPVPSGTFKVRYEKIIAKERKVIRYQELPVLKSVIRAERNGFKIDLPQLKVIEKRIIEEQESLTARIYKLAGRQYKLSSNPQTIQVFQELGIEITEKTKKGAPSVGKDSLFFLADKHPIVSLILKQRQNVKLLSGYVRSSSGLARYADANARIHTSINTVGARTGRSSSSNPNLQNIPASKDTFGIRDCFIAPPGQHIVCLDFAQIELRIMALLSKDPAMCRILCDPEGDIHQNTADEFSVDRSPTAKQINFLLLYAGKPWSLARKLTLEGVPTSESVAKAYIDRYAEVYTGVPNYRKELLRHHQLYGYVNYMLGRRRYLIDVDWSSRREMHKAETTLSNNICQGSAQDWLKHAIVRTDPYAINPDSAALKNFDHKPSYRARIKDYARKLEKYRAEFRKANLRWALQVHDESLWFVDKYAAPEIGQKLAEIMTWMPYIQPTVKIDVPINADGGVGYSWAEAKSKNPRHKIHCFGQVE